MLITHSLFLKHTNREAANRKITIAAITEPTMMAVLDPGVIVTLVD